MTTSTPNATHVSGEPLTTTITENAAPGLLRSHVDERIARIRPSSTPLDQISRMVGARRAGSMKVDYYSVDTKPGSTTVAASVPPAPVEPGGTFEVRVSDKGVVAASETVMFPDTKLEDGYPLVCYVDKAADDSLTLRPVLPEGQGDGEFTPPAIRSGALVVRMGRAAGELDVQTGCYSALPKKRYNYCQIFKAQVEESLLQRLSDKEVGWTFSDQEESAIVDMRLGMEKSYLFGCRSRIEMADGSQVMLTGGIWAQAGREAAYDPSALTEDKLTDILREAFTNGGGSTQKVLLGGSELISALSKLDKVRVVSDGDKKVVWGIDFDRINSKFGTVYVKLSEIFDQCGMAANGIIVDPEYITKYTHIPFKAERISFHKQGVRNTEGVVLTEVSCLVLRYPDAHMRIVGK